MAVHLLQNIKPWIILALFLSFLSCSTSSDDETYEVVVASSSTYSDISGEEGYYQGTMTISGSNINQVFTSGASFTVFVNREYQEITTDETVEERRKIDSAQGYEVVRTFDRTTTSYSRYAQVKIQYNSQDYILSKLEYDKYNSSFVLGSQVYNFHVGPNLSSFGEIIGDSFPITITEKSILLPGALGTITLTTRLSNAIAFETPNALP